MQFSKVGCTGKIPADKCSSTYLRVDPELREFESDARFNFHYTSHLKNSRLRVRIGLAGDRIELVAYGKKSVFTLFAHQRVNGQRA